MNVKFEHKIIASAAAGAIILWILDAVIDAFVFGSDAFLESLFPGPSHELYFRALMTAGLLFFGVLFARLSQKRRRIEQRYENLVELTNDIISITNKDGDVVFINDAGCRILERTREEIIGRPCTELLHPEDRAQACERHFEIASLPLETVSVQNRYITKSGKVIPVMHNVRVLRNERGEFTGTQGIARDMTEAKEKERELRTAIIRAEDEKARSASIVAAIGDGISIIDRDFTVTYQNAVHQALTGGDFAGRRCFEAFTNAAVPCEVCPVAEVFKDGRIHLIEKNVVWNDRRRAVEISASPLRDASGAIIAAIEAVRDVSARKKAEEQLKLFSAAIEEAMDGIQIVDMKGRVLYSNKAVKDIYGFKPEELAGTFVGDMNEDREFASKVILPAMRTKSCWSGEVTVVHKSGKHFPVWLATSIVSSADGAPIAMIGIIRDISERKQAEDIMKRHHEQLIKIVEERTFELTVVNDNLRREIADREKMEQELVKTQKLESLGILAGGIAHDFNNLLASILGNISLAMLDINPADDTYRQLEAAERASLRAQDLTRQLLTFSKGGEPVKRPTLIAELIKEAAGFALRGARVRYDFFFSPGLWLVEADEGQISQVIHNLVINADHAMPEGGTITIRCDNSAVEAHGGVPLPPGDYVKITIQDHGIGIAREHLSKIFDPYFTTKQKGSGLGLAVSYSIIKKHGGHIMAESVLGAGTTFTIYLPATRAARQPPRQDSERIPLGTGRILIMDDEEEVRITTGEILKRLGYTIEFADDGERAIELYQQALDAGRPFDAVIMDLTVPGGMGGKDAVLKLIELNPEVSAIVSSGYSNDPIMSDFRKYGFKGMVTKPYRIRDLGMTLHEVLLGGGTTKSVTSE